MNKTKKQIKVYRYDPDKDKTPYMKDYEVDMSELKGVMVLDALERIKAQDPSLSFRRSCGEGVCGSDGMNINGKNGLACIVPLNELPKTIMLRPLPGLPVVRDLIVDMEPFYQQLHRGDPYLQPDESNLPEKEFIQTPEERAKLDGQYECILCACCTSACPSYWWNPDKFMGPAALLWVNRFLQDSRDSKKEERLEKLQDQFSVYRCRSIMNCVDVCPKNLNPTQAINKIRKELVKEAV